MKILTHTQLTEMLAAHRGVAILSIVSVTEPKFRKTGCPFTTLQKVEYKRVVVGANYQRAVNRQITAETGEQEPAFKASPRKWGEYLVPDKVVIYLGQLYLSTQARNPRKPMKTVWLADGKEVSKDEVKDYLSVSTSRKQEEHGLHGKKQVMVRDFKMESVKKIMMDHEEYALTSDQQPQLGQLVETLKEVKEVLAEKRANRPKSNKTLMRLEMAAYDRRE